MSECFKIQWLQKLSKKTKLFFTNTNKKFTSLELYSFGIAFVTLGFAIAVFTININISWHKDWVDVAKVVTSILIFSSIIMAIINYRYVKKWNQRNAAIMGLHESQIKLSSAIRYLDKHIKLTKNFETKTTYDIVFLHNTLGVFIDDNSFVFHGEHQNIQSLSRQNNLEYKTMFIEGVKGRKIYNAIESYLNEIEYIATACEMEIFDKKTVYELKGGSLISGYIVFKNLIYHNRYDKRHHYGPTLYEHFENLIFEFAEMRDMQIKKPKESDYLTPFDRK